MAEPQYEVTPGPPPGFQPAPSSAPAAPAEPQPTYSKRLMVGIGLLSVGTVAAAVLLPMYLHASERAAYYEQSRDEARANVKTTTETATVVKTETQVQTETKTVTVEPPPPPPPAGPKTTFASGTYQVNIDIAPGTYVAPGGSNCYWERLSGLSGEFEDVITNDWTQGGQVYVTIQTSDVAFKTDGCGEWTTTG